MRKIVAAGNKRARHQVEMSRRTISFMNDHILHNHNPDGIDRRGFLKCMAWAGTGVLWTVSGGILASKTLAEIAKAGGSLPSATDLSFLQISDSHIGFSKEANKDVTATFKIALDRINAMPTPPAWRFKTLTSPMKWIPFLLKLYQPEPLAPTLFK